jgi:hypothetical protein
MAQPNHTLRLAETEEALTVLFCLVDDAYAHLNPRARCYESLKQLADSEVIALALFQQLRGVESERSFLRDAERFFSHLFPGVEGLYPSSFHRRVRKLRRLEWRFCAATYSPRWSASLRRCSSTRLCFRFCTPAQVSQGSGFSGAAWVRWGSFSVYGVKLHLICATNGVPLSYELTPANVADVSLAEELIAEARLGKGVARKLLGDLAYRSKELKEALAEVGILLSTEPSERRHGVRQHIEIAISSLKRVFGLGETLATTVVGLATRIAAKICAYTYAFVVNRMLGRPQSRIKELWART